MKHFFFIPEKELEEKVAKKLQEEMQEMDPQARITVYPALESSPKKEILKENTFPFVSWIKLLKFYFTVRHSLQNRKEEEERVLIYLGNKLSNPFLLHLLTCKKIFWVNISQDFREKRISFLQRFLISRSVETILTNDQKMNRHYRQNFLPSYFIGNILADLCPPSSFEFLHGKNPILALLPKSSRFEEELLTYLELTEVLWPSDQKYYFLLVIPKEISIKAIKQIAEKGGWLYFRSFEGDIVEGYLWKQPIYVNLTRFYGEALGQADLVLSSSPISIIQAAGMGKKVLYSYGKNVKEIVQMLSNQIFFFEYCRSIWDRFGTQGGIKYLTAYFLWGVVEDQKFNQYFLKKGVKP